MDTVCRLRFELYTPFWFILDDKNICICAVMKDHVDDRFQWFPKAFYERGHKTAPNLQVFNSIRGPRKTRESKQLFSWKSARFAFTPVPYTAVSPPHWPFCSHGQQRRHFISFRSCLRWRCIGCTDLVLLADLLYHVLVELKVFCPFLFLKRPSSNEKYKIT